MRTRTSPTETVTISLPRAMRKTLDELRLREHRTTSELVCEALRVYAATRATYTPTAAELRAIAKGRASESMTLDNFFSHVETTRARKEDDARRRASSRKAKREALGGSSEQPAYNSPTLRRLSILPGVPPGPG